MVIAFVLEILLPAAQYLDQQRYVELISLQISDGYRVVAILVGIALAAIIALLRLLETTTLRSFGLALLTVGGIAALLWIGQPLLLAMGFGSLIVFFVVIVAACVGIGVPIAFAFGIATMSYLGLTSAMPLSVVVNRMDEGMSNLLLLSVPMFVFLGLLMEMTGIARVMVAFLAALVGHVRGGLSYVLLGAMYLVSGISGSKAADMAAVAPVLFPEMRRRGSHPGELAALLASSSAMSETIPPSLVLITIGSVTNVSITALFTGGLLPAAVAALALVVVSWYRSRHMDTGGGERAPVSLMLRTLRHRDPRPDPAVRDPRRGDRRRRHRDRGLHRRRGLHRAARAVRLPAVRLAAHLSDAGRYAVADRRGDADHRHRDGDGLGADAVGLFPVAGRRRWRRCRAARLGFLAITAVTFVILGSVLEGIPAIVLFGPLLFPVAKAMGVHEVHYAMVIILAMGIGLFAPPFGVGFYGACAIGRVSPDDALGRMWPYLAALAVALAIVVAVPWLSIGFL